MIDQQKILQYAVIRKLGEGSFGQVLLGENSDGKQVAIKKISKERVLKVNKLHQPFIEKEILFTLNRFPNNFVTKIQGTHSDDHFVYLILEFCQGGTLEDFIKKNSSIQISILKKIIIRLILMLEFLHQKKLIHRDIKPSNILLTKDGYLKLSDFGTCFVPENYFRNSVAQQIKSIKNISQNKKQERTRKMSEEDETSTVSSERRYTFVGTACYMAPQLLQEDKCSHQSDLWALGCIFYELLHKKSPFFDENEGMIWSKILNSEIKVFKAEGKQASEEEYNLQRLIEQLLEKQVQKRLGSGLKGYQNLKSHIFFQGVQWAQFAQKPLLEVKKFVESELERFEFQFQKKSSEKDKVIFSGVVGKKMYFGNYKERTLVLHSFPKLAYYDTDSGQKKGQILLSKATPVKQEGKYFEVSTDKKVYFFKSKQAKQWVEMIKFSVLNAFY